MKADRIGAIKMKIAVFRTVALLWICFAACAAYAQDLTLWYSKPAQKWSAEALPLGNGRMGGMVFGAPARDRIQFNEDSLWTGDENPSGDYKKMGAYQAFGDVFIDLPSHATAEQYRRELNIGEAVARTTYQSGGVKYQREYFCSHPDQVLVIRLTADKSGSYTGSVELADMHKATLAADANRMTAAGELSNGMKYESQLLAVNQGGSLKPAQGKIEFSGCDSLTLILAAGTDYVMDGGKNWHGEPPHARVSQQIQKASAQSYDALKTAHIKDFQSLFNRVQLNLGEAPADRRAMPTDERLKRAGTEGGDPGLENMLFQMGRYLVISCSRDALPANLQGLWNDSNTPPWSSDYHTNINIQMNYWPAEPANLSECHEPLLNLISSQRESWTKLTLAAKDLGKGFTPKRGWTVRTSHNITGGMGWQWNNPSNAWYCLHFWEHYAFTGDKDFLKKQAYPILK
ncbi:MAG: glycoside hydrolase family 95 protein [Candidatus Sumerlaeota bacterium]|nr:glycoside hydrolase family 95 protein [Candidatus Sumerlaeota bacterium]